MLKRLLQKARKTRFQKLVSGIRQTPPLQMSDAPLVILSMLCQRDIDPWLVAIKSLYPRIGAGAVCILNDGSLNDADVALLRRHVPSLEVRQMANADTSDLPTGGCWERLITLVDLSQDRYAIQMDADIVTLGEVPEVRECIQNQTGFVLTNYLRPGIVSLPEASAFTRNSSWAESQHVQTLAELALEELPNADSRYYMRSSAAFTGIPAGIAKRETVLEFHQQMHAKLGEKWLEWGSEQVASNYLIANLPGSLELPCPKYANAMPHLSLDDSVLLHFFGSVRYLNDRYHNACRAVIESAG